MMCVPPDINKFNDLLDLWGLIEIILKESILLANNLDITQVGYLFNCHLL